MGDNYWLRVKYKVKVKKSASGSQGLTAYKMEVIMKKEYIIKLKYNPDNDKIEISGGEDMEELFAPAYFEIDGVMIKIPNDMKKYITSEILGIS
jgi:hypothetical protein